MRSVTLQTLSSLSNQGGKSSLVRKLSIRFIAHIIIEYSVVHTEIPYSGAPFNKLLDLPMNSTNKVIWRLLSVKGCQDLHIEYAITQDPCFCESFRLFPVSMENGPLPIYVVSTKGGVRIAVSNLVVKRGTNSRWEEAHSQQPQIRYGIHGAER